MPKMIGLINENQSIVTKEFVEGLAETRVPITRKINGQELTQDLTIEADYTPITNEEIDEICGQILGESLTIDQITSLYNQIDSPIMFAEEEDF